MRVEHFAVVVASMAVWPAQTAAARSTWGVAPLRVTEANGHLRTSTTRYLSFRLPPGSWQSGINDQGEPVSGLYVRVTQEAGQRCVTNLGVGGRGQRSRPTLRTIGRSDHIHRGTTASGLRWLSAWDELPPTPPDPYASAYRRAPKQATFRWARFDVGTGFEEPTTSACRATVRRLDLGSLARTFRVERGRLPIGPTR